MDYIDFGDIQDAVLDCKYEDIVYGNEIINSLASRLKVTDIPEPVPYIVKRLGVVAACYNRCLLQTGTDPTTVFNGAGGVENSDIYAQKLKLYKAEMERLMASITAADLASPEGRGEQVFLCIAHEQTYRDHRCYHGTFTGPDTGSALEQPCYRCQPWQ